MTSDTVIQTAKAGGYLQQLCKHFSHKIDVKFSREAGWIKFDFGCANLTADGDILKITVNADSLEDLDRLKHVLSSHLERFAFREDFQINWSG
jgi:hypothetical protein